jgi:hypothetical protein
MVQRPSQQIIFVVLGHTFTLYKTNYFRIGGGKKSLKLLKLET